MADYDKKLLDGEHLGYYTQKIKNALNGKQETISDLASIRSNAATGAGLKSTVDTINGDYLKSSDKTELETSIDGKVAKVDGKGLSTNDFDNDAKTKLAGLENYDDTALTGRVSTIEGKEAEWDAKQVALVFGTAYDATTNKAATITDINNAISGITGFHFEIVETLPATGESNVIYLVLKSQSEEGNIYTEYAYINNAWEKLGDTSIQLDYLTNGEIDTIWNSNN